MRRYFIYETGCYKEKEYSENKEELLEIKTMRVKIISVESFEGKIKELSQKVGQKDKRKIKEKG